MSATYRIATVAALLVACAATPDNPDAAPAIATRDWRWTSTTIGGSPASDPALASWGPGRLDLFYVGPAGSLLHRSFQNAWSDEEDLGGHLTSSPAAVSWGSDHIDVFARGVDETGRH